MRIRRSSIPTALVLGLVVGLLGSFFDDLVGGGTLATIGQVALWLASAALVLPAIAGLVSHSPPGGRPLPH